MIAYFDCFSGASGDMILSALVDAGVSVETLRAELAQLALLAGEWSIEAQVTRRGPVRATHVHVHTRGPSPTRHLSDIVNLIETGGVSPMAKERSIAIFRRLAAAEAKVHGIPVERVHFHEVGAVDAIVDIVGAAVGLELLGIERVYASPLPLGSGTTSSQHGPLPLPAPATLELLAQAGAPTRGWGDGFELVTPTGAAILTTLATFQQPPMTLWRIGYGAGGRDLPWPNVLRLWLGKPLPAHQAEHVLLETNIDDMNPEVFGYVMERLFAAGALDVYFTPIFMKKNRPATMLSVIARADQEDVLANLILHETTTLGLRVQQLRRHEAGREVRMVHTEHGEIAVKVKLLDGQAVSAAPEYESCRRVAAERGMPISAVYQAALRASGEYVRRET